MEEKTWKDFQEAGLFWWINRTLHLFGWSLVYEEHDGEILKVYPAKTKWRGFERATEIEGFQKLTAHIESEIKILVADLK